MEEEITVDFLFIGLEGCGKSYLIKQLYEFSKSKSKKKKKRKEKIEISRNFHYTIPTAGQVQDTFKLTPFGEPVRIKEVGGSMAGTWERHISDCKVVVVAGAVVEFLSVYSKIGEKKRIILLFNKSDSSVKFEKERFESMIRLKILNSTNKKYGVEVLEVSGYDGDNLQILVSTMENSIRVDAEEKMRN